MHISLSAVATVHTGSSTEGTSWRPWELCNTCTWLSQPRLPYILVAVLRVLHNVTLTAAAAILIAVLGVPRKVWGIVRFDSDGSDRAL
jgi:hypothetical protein